MLHRQSRRTQPKGTCGVVPRRDASAHRRHLRALLGILGAAALLLWPTAATGHTRLERSAPSRGDHLAAVPRELRLTFSEAPELAFTRVQLLGSDSATVALGELRIDSVRTVVAPIRGQLVAGTYTVVWQIAGADGHPIRGRYSFTIAPGAQGLATSEAHGEPAGNVTAPGASPPPPAHHDPTSMPESEGFDAESPLYVVIRWITFGALLVVIGAVAFRNVVLAILRQRSHPASGSALIEPAENRAARLGLTAAIALGAVALARLLAQSYAMHGPSDTLDSELVGAMLSRTVWGWGWLLQLLGVVVALAGFALARRGRRGGWIVATLGTTVLAFTPGLSGHAASVPRLTGLSIFADGLHVIGAGGWLGSLLVVLLAGIPAGLALPAPERNRSVADLVNAFSPTALAFAALAAVTGVFAAWTHLGSVSDLWQSQYGLVLLLKLGILTGVIATGAFNWRRVRPGLGDDVGSRRIKRSATAELAIAALVLLVTAILVATPTPRDHRREQVAAGREVRP